MGADRPAQVAARRAEVEQPLAGGEREEAPPQDVVRRAGDFLPRIFFGHGRDYGSNLCAIG
jgi:hypothetical protein